MIADLKPYPEYRESDLPWLGECPATWKILRGKSVFGRVDVRSKTGMEELLTVSANHGVIPRRQTSVTMFMAKSYIGHKLCWPGDLVVNSLWAWMQGLGVAKNHGLISSAYSVYRPRAEYSEYGNFFHHLFRSDAYKWELQTRSKGVWISRLQLTDIAFMDMPVLLPPPDEQATIVRFLNHANQRIERTIRAKRKVIALLNEQKQVIIHRAVTRGLDPNVRLKPSGIPWLEEVPEHWEARKLKFEMSFRGGGTPSKSNNSYWNGDIPWVSPKDMKSEVIVDTIDHITSRAVAESSTNLVPAGSLLMVVRSGILQRKIPVALCSREVSLNQDMKALSSKGRLNVDFFVLFIRGCERTLLTEWTKQGATVESIEHQFLANSKVPIPPLSEESAIVEHITVESEPLDTAISHTEREISLLREYRTRLIADVVTGKLDVREAAAQLPENTDDTDYTDNTDNVVITDDLDNPFFEEGEDDGTATEE